MNEHAHTSDDISVILSGKRVFSTAVDSIDANSSHLAYNVTIQLKDKDGNVKEEREVHNTVTQAGKNAIADQVLAAPTLTKAGWMAVGTGTPSSSALGVELSRVALTSKTRSTSVITFQGDWAAGNATGALTEAGIFDAASAGNEWAYQSFAAINKGASDTLSIQWTLTLS